MPKSQSRGRILYVELKSGYSGNGPASIGYVTFSKTGKTLWEAGSGAHIASSPITYQLDGRQYVLMSSGGMLFAWALPETAGPPKP